MAQKGVTMFADAKIVWVIAFMAALFAATTIAGPQKSVPHRPPDKFALGAEEVRQLVLLLGGENGKVTKAEFLKFMEEEFDRLDVNKNGELDVRELKESRIRASPGAVGKR